LLQIGLDQFQAVQKLALAHLFESNDCIPITFCRRCDTQLLSNFFNFGGVFRSLHGLVCFQALLFLLLLE